MTQKALLIFQDDGSLRVVARLASALRGRGWTPTLAYAATLPVAEAISARQFAEILGPRPEYRILAPGEVARSAPLRGYDLVASTRFPRILRSLARWNALAADRPVFASFFTGLELRPDVGFAMRRTADIVCFNSRSDLAAFEAADLPHRPPHQRRLRYSPMTVREPGRSRRDGTDVLFLTQSVCPLGLEGRRSIAEALRRAALAHPDRRFVLKLRHLASENRRHHHVERFPYQDLIRETGEPPSNLVVSDAPLGELLTTAGAVVSSTSTGCMEALARGIPTGFLLDFVGSGSDPLVPPMHRVLSGSGLSTTLDDLVRLHFPPANDTWLADMLSEPSDLDDLLAAVDAVAAQRRAERVVDPLRPLRSAVLRAADRVATMIRRLA